MLQLENTPVLSDSIVAPKSDLAALKGMSVDDLIAKVANGLADFAYHLALAILVYYIGRFIIRKIYTFTEAVMVRRRVDESLSTFTLSFVRIVLYFILIIIVIGILGINTSSFLALFASAGVAIGMALSGTLQNFAGGVLVLLLKPYKIGDYIEAQGYSGTVTEIQIFYTIISTPDNKTIIIPNGGLSTGSINNWSRADYRRVSWTVSISYGDDVDTAREAILAILDSDQRVVKDSFAVDREKRKLLKVREIAGEIPVQPHRPRSFWSRMFGKSRNDSMAIGSNDERPGAVDRQPDTTDRSPSVMLGELAASSVDLTVRAWVPSAEYWNVYYAVNEKIYKTLPLKGIHFPYPHLDVSLSGAN